MTSLPSGEWMLTRRTCSRVLRRAIQSTSSAVIPTFTLKNQYSMAASGWMESIIHSFMAAGSDAHHHKHFLIICTAARQAGSYADFPLGDHLRLEQSPR